MMAAGAVTAGLSSQASAAFDSSPKVGKTAPDVVVIGGGFAGVTAARDLQLRGLDVVLLEARNRLGGRTFSTRFGDEHAELGGTAIHWAQPHVWAEIMRYGLEVVDNAPVREGGDVLWMSRGRLQKSDPFEFFTKTDDLNKRYFAEAGTLVKMPYERHLSAEAAKVDHMSAGDRLRALNLDPLDSDLMRSILDTYFLGSADEGAYTELLLDWTQAGKDSAAMSDITVKWAFKDGTISLIDRMVADGGFEVRLSSVVTAVKQGTSGVQVVTEDGNSINCRYVVVTAPINTLESIEFQPPLNAAKQAMARERTTPVGQKLYIKVKGVFNHSIQAQPGQAISTLWPISWNDDGTTTLIAYTNGPVEGFSPYDPESVQAFLAQYVPDVQVLQTLSYDWSLDPYSRGAHSLFRKGQLSRYLEGLRERENRVFFAGDALASGWRAYIDGAIESGITTAQELVRVAHAEPKSAI